MRQKKRKKAARQTIIMAIAVVFALAVLIVLAFALYLVRYTAILRGTRKDQTEGNA